MIIILNNSLQRLGVIKNAIDSTRLEAVNGENTIDFTAVLDSKLASLIDENSIYELNEDYFDTAIFKKQSNDDNSCTIQVESEHISYRLNNPEYNCETFTQTGTPEFILGQILTGTGFTVGTVEPTANVTYSAQEKKSRRQILMEFVALVKGELDFNKMTISILNHRGSSVPSLALKDRNVRIVSKSVNKRELDETGAPVVSYECEPIFLPGQSYALGDDIILYQKELGINEKLRVVKITENPYDEFDKKFEFSNYINGLAGSLYEIATQAVSKDKLYNGVKIGPEYGFEAIRNDKKARAYFKSDGMAFQSGDGTGGNWKDRLYYAYDSEKDTTSLVFDGEFSVDAINAIKANIDIVVSNTIITQTLYADKAMIAELTVDEVNTSKKVELYFNHDTRPIKYIKIFDINDDITLGQRSVIHFITAVTDGAQTEQVTNRHGLPVFWADGEYSGITMTVTEWPVITYKYTETITSVIDEDPLVTDVDIMDDNITIRYSDGTIHGYAITKDADGHVTSIGDININNGGTTNAPNFVSAETSIDGTEIILTFDKAIADVTGKQAEFTVNRTSSNPILVSAVANSDGSQVTLTFIKDMTDPTGKESQFNITI